MSSRITDYRGFADHATYLGDLIGAHARKDKFWGLVAAEAPAARAE